MAETGAPSQTYTPTGKILVPTYTGVSVGCIVNGGFASESGVQVEVIDVQTITNSIPNVPNSTITYLEVTLNILPWITTAESVFETLPSGVINEGFNTSSKLTRQTLGYTSEITFTCSDSSNEFMDSYSFTEHIPAKTLSFKETAKGWVSFKSFYPDIALSTANDYYTLFRGNLYLHHVEAVDRNTFYEDVLDFPFTPSSVDVMLNDNASMIKEFNTLNYEGSQAKVNKFVHKENLQIPEQPNTSYSDQEYYNLSDKDGWNVSSIITNDEDGYIDEFIEKEGKWFNNVKRKVDLGLRKADTSDFSFQGIGFFDSVLLSPTASNVYGCTNPSAGNYNPLATIDDGSCLLPRTSGGEDNGSSGETSNGTSSESDGGASSKDGNGTSSEGKGIVLGCTDPESTNYNPLASVNDGSCFNLGDNACETILSAGEACADWQNFLIGYSGSPFNTKQEVADYWAGYFNSLPQGYVISGLQMLEQLEGCCGIQTPELLER